MGAKIAAADPETSALASGGAGANVASRSLGATGDMGSTGGSLLQRTQRTAKDDSSLMLRLMMKEREQVLPEDKLFYHQIAEHIDKLLLETSKHKQGRVDGEEPEKLSTTGFLEREQRYTKEIRNTEEMLQTTIADKENLQRDLSNKTAELKTLNEESAQAIRESVALQEQATAEEQQLRKELRDIVSDKRELQDRLSLGNKDLELLQQENERLRAHVKAFQRDVNEILT